MQLDSRHVTICDTLPFGERGRVRVENREDVTKADNLLELRHTALENVQFFQRSARADGDARHRIICDETWHTGFLR